MEWIKVGDGTPINGLPLLLYHQATEVVGVIVGWYDSGFDVYRTNGTLPINPSHWSYIKLPPGEDE